MNILYYGFSGSSPNILLAIVLFIIAAVGFITSIIIAFMERKISESFIGLAMVIVFVILGIGVFDFLDTRTPIIKATINDEVSWQEIYNKYEIESQEGEIYTFKVKDITNEEWDAFLKEYYNE